MLTRQQHQGVVWIDLEAPTNEEVHSVMEEFSIDPLVGEEMLLPSTKPKVDQYDHYLYLILHFPALKHTHQKDKQEVNFIIGKEFLITVHYDTIDPMHAFAKIFEVNATLNKSAVGNHAGFLFFYMIKKLYGTVEQELEHIHTTLEEIEVSVFQGHEKEMVSALSNVSRDVLNFKQAISMHKEIIELFEVSGTAFFGEDFRGQLRAVAHERNRVLYQLDTNCDFLHELRETNNSLLFTKQNEAMKIIAILAFVTFPLSLIASVFSMNTVHTPIVGAPGDFWIIFVAMALVTFSMVIFFKYKKWL